MLQQLEELKINALQELEGISNIKELESWRVHYLGRKSHLTKVLRSLTNLPLEEKRVVGARTNTIALIPPGIVEDGLTHVPRHIGEACCRTKTINMKEASSLVLVVETH